jgi:hypothetical protein
MYKRFCYAAKFKRTPKEIHKKKIYILVRQKCFMKNKSNKRKNQTNTSEDLKCTSSGNHAFSVGLQP